MANRKLWIAALIIALVLAGCRPNPKALAKQTYNVTVEVLSNPQKAEKSLEKAAAIKQKLAKLTSAERQLYNEELEDLTGQGVRALAILGGLPDGNGGSMGKALDAVLGDISATDSDGDNDGGGFISRLLGGLLGGKSKTASDSASSGDSGETADSKAAESKPADSGKAADSKNGGIDWGILDDTPFKDKNIYSVAYGKDKFVMVSGDVDIIVTLSLPKGEIKSENDIKWTTTNTGGKKYETVVYGDNKFIVVGKTGGAAYSTDGVKWTDYEYDDLNEESILKVFAVQGKGKHVAAAFGGMKYSSDGKTWNAMDSSVSDMFGIGGTTNMGVFFDYGGGITACAWGKDKFVMVGKKGKMAYSPDGVKWKEVDVSSNDLFGDINGITYGNGMFVAVGSYGAAAVSTDGIKWTKIKLPGFSGWDKIYGIAFGNGRFVIVGEDGTISYSY
jgi:hypothetical protein